MSAAPGFGDLVGKRILGITGLREGSEEIQIHTDVGIYRLYHDSECSESVEVAQVDGDPADVIGQIVVVAEVRETDMEDSLMDCARWTFYTIRAVRGDLDFRWFGASNGYYSVDVNVAFTPVGA